MKRTFAILAVIGLFASVSMGELLVGRYPCARDNFNDASNPLANNGGACDQRWCKPWESAIHYADWTEADLEEIWATVNGPPPAGYTGWEVRYANTGCTWFAANPGMVVWFGAFLSHTDWVEGNGDLKNGKTGDGTGASHAYAQCSNPTVCGAQSIDWVCANDDVTACDFRVWPPAPCGPNSLGLNQVTNSVPFIGYTPSTGPGDIDTNQCVVDLFPGGTLDVLVNDPECRGLRAGVDGTINMDPVPPQNGYNEGIYARGQWGTPGAACALLVYAIPEPATMLLIAVGGVGVLLRKRR